MARIILVHGAWHGAWCYDKLVPLLAARGHDARAIDLPGHGANGAPGWGIGLDAYANAIAAAAAGPAPAMLVGHSMGGLAISRAAELAPERVAGLIYLCAFLPRSGESLLRLGAEDRASLVPGILRRNILAGVATVDPSGARAAFYGDCADADVQASTQKLQAQPVRPLITPVRVTQQRFGRAPRKYIFCTQDRAIPLAQQKRMADRVGVADSVTLETSHSPFLSAPEACADAIDRLSGSA